MSLTQDDQKTGKPNTGKGEKGKGKRVRVAPVAVGFVDEIPPRTRSDYWALELPDLKANAGKSKKYEAMSATTASYLKGRYGLETTTRARPDGKVDLFVMYPAKDVGGVAEPDEAKVAANIEKYGPKDDK